MADRVSPSRSPRDYPRDHDHRIPAFQILMNEGTAPSPSPPPSVVNKRSVHPNTNYRYSSNNKNKSVMDGDKSNNNRKSLPGHHVQKLFPEVHHNVALKESVASCVSSGYRGPACSFAKQFQLQHSNHSSGRNTRSVSPASKYDSSLEEEWEDSEPADVVVFNANKKRSRQNILCPLTDSEFKNINTEEEAGKRGKGAGRGRSTSAPNDKQPQKYGSGRTQHRPSIPDDNYNVDRLEEHYASIERAACGSASTASTYSAQIATVAQQLEEIQQAQNDVLKQLGEQISNVTSENESLKSEVEHVRTQKESLLHVIKETTDELERMKHIFRIRGLHLPPPLQKENSGQGDSGHRRSTPPDASPSASEQVAQHPNHHHHHPNNERRRQSGSRESSEGRTHPGDQSRRHHDTKMEGEDSPVDCRELIAKKKKPPRTINEEGHEIMSLSSRIPVPGPHAQHKRHQRHTSNIPIEKAEMYARLERGLLRGDEDKSRNHSNSSNKSNRRRSASPKRQEVSNDENNRGGFCVRIFGCCMRKPANFLEQEDDMTLQEQQDANNNDTPENDEAD